MPQPYDYTLTAPDPVDQLFRGMEFADQRKANAQNLALGQQTMDLRAAEEQRAGLAFEQQQADRRAALQAAMENRKRTLAVQERLGGLAGMISAGTATANDFAAIATEFPEFADQLSKSWEGMTAERKANDTAALVKGVTALKLGRPEIAIQMLEDRAKAAEASGDQMEADVSRATIAGIKADPTAAAAVLGTLLYATDPEVAGQVFGKPVEPTASQKDYQFYADQETAAGRTPLSFNEWDLQAKRAAAPTTNVSVGAGGDGSTKPGQVFDEIKASADAARAAVTGLRALNEASTALSDEGGAITGFAANKRLAAAKLGALFGVVDPAIIENTETFRSAIAPQVAAMLKATVGSVQVSNADREFAEKAAAGSIELDEASIKRLLGIMTKASKAAIALHKERLDKVYPPGSGADRERALFEVAPMTEAPSGGNEDLTPEERTYLGLP